MGIRCANRTCATDSAVVNPTCRRFRTLGNFLIFRVTRRHPHRFLCNLGIWEESDENHDHKATSGLAQDIEMDCVDAAGQSMRLDASLGYQPSDPYAVAVTFRTPGGDVVWTFARELLARGRPLRPARGTSTCGRASAPTAGRSSSSSSAHPMGSCSSRHPLWRSPRSSTSRSPWSPRVPRAPSSTSTS